jgi:hypothetical protein
MIMVIILIIKIIISKLLIPKILQVGRSRQYSLCWTYLMSLHTARNNAKTRKQLTEMCVEGSGQEVSQGTVLEFS